MPKAWSEVEGQLHGTEASRRIASKGVEMEAASTQVIVISGVGGVGKTTAGWELREMLKRKHVAHALIDTDNISWCYPAAPDRFNTLLVAQNLKSIWQNYSAAGANKLVISGVLETAEQFDLWRDAIPNATFAVFELRAPEQTIRARLLTRGDSYDFEGAAARSQELAEILKANPVSARSIETDDLSTQQVAAKILELSGWV